MGASAIQSNVVTTYKANIDDQLRNVKTLEAANQRAADKLVAAKERESAAVAKAQIQQETAIKKTDSRFVDSTNKMKRGLGFVTSAVGSVTAALGVAGMAVAAAGVLFEAFGDKQANNLRMLQDEATKLGGDGAFAFEKWGQAAENLNRRLKATADLFALMDKAKAGLAGERRAAGLAKDYGGFSKGGLKFTIDEDARFLDNYVTPVDATAEDREKSLAEYQYHMDRRAYAQGKLADLEAEELRAAEKRRASWAKGASSRVQRGLTTSNDNWNPEAALRDPWSWSGNGPVGGSGVRPLDLNLNSGLAGDTRYGRVGGALSASGMSGLDTANNNTITPQTGLVEKVFGPVDKLQLYADAIGVLKGATESAFASWVDGSATASQAFKKMFGEILAGESKLMFGEALKHGAFAIGSLATGNLKGASLHGIAAAKFAAGAVVTGAIARQLGGSGASGSAGGGADGGSGSVYGGRRGPDTGGTINIYTGDDWASKSTRERATQAREIVDTARRGGSGESSIVRYD
jgi:hypothetical protein